MFHFPGCAIRLISGSSRSSRERFPHSEIFGSLVARRLPEAYRRHAASFIASFSQGIHHLLLINFLLGNLSTIYFSFFDCLLYIWIVKGLEQKAARDGRRKPKT